MPFTYRAPYCTSMRSHDRAIATIVLPAVLLCIALASTGCGGWDSKPAAANEAGAAGANYTRRFTDSDLGMQLLQRGAVPTGLVGSQSFLMPNDVVAKLLPDERTARESMEKFGRVQGAAVDYRLAGQPRASEQVVAIVSTVSWYSTIGGAQSVVADPTMELALQGFGFNTSEISADKIAQQSRAFRGLRAGDTPDLASYVVVYRRDNLIGVVVVVVRTATDDGGRLAMNLARRQANLPLPAVAK